MLLSVVLPCYNEADNLRSVHRALDSILDRAEVEVELVFVDDGSQDDTLLLLRELASEDSRVEYLSFSRNFGKESAMLAGLGIATGDVVAIMDGDLQHPPGLLPHMLERFEAGYDQVIARRTRQGDGRRRTVASRAYYRIVNTLIDVRLDDGAGDFRLLSRRAVDAVLALPEYNRFSKGLFSWIGFPTTHVHYENEARLAGSSQWSFRRLVDYGVDGVLSFNNKPLRLAIYIGATVAGLSALYIFGLILAVFLSGVQVPGYFTLITAICLLGGLQLIFLGVVGEYVGRIYYEVKRRPHYLVKESTQDLRVSPGGARLSLLRGHDRS